LDSGEKSTTTDGSGNYNLSNLAAGTYKVRQVLPAGSVQTFPLNGFGINTTVTTGQTLSNQNFGAKQNTSSNTASISGNLFADINGNLIKDSTDANIGGRTVYLDA